jgi:hypothetical protein
MNPQSGNGRDLELFRNKIVGQYEGGQDDHRYKGALEHYAYGAFLSWLIPGFPMGGIYWFGLW